MWRSKSIFKSLSRNSALTYYLIRLFREKAFLVIAGWLGSLRDFLPRCYSDFLLEHDLLITISKSYELVLNSPLIRDFT